MTSEWVQYRGSPQPEETYDKIIEVRYRGGKHWTGEANRVVWGIRNAPIDVIAYRVVQLEPGKIEPASGGGKLSGDHYYRVTINDPISPEIKPYTAECADIIEALGMTFNEGEAFKALWRLAAARQGRGKAGNKPQYDADKVAHYGARVAAQTTRGAQ